MFRDFEYPFYFRQCKHILRYIITYNIFINALYIRIDKDVLEDIFFLIICLSLI